MTNDAVRRAARTFFQGMIGVLMLIAIPLLHQMIQSVVSAEHAGGPFGKHGIPDPQGMTVWLNPHAGVAAPPQPMRPIPADRDRRPDRHRG